MTVSYSIVSSSLGAPMVVCVNLLMSCTHVPWDTTVGALKLDVILATSCFLFRLPATMHLTVHILFALQTIQMKGQPAGLKHILIHQKKLHKT